MNITTPYYFKILSEERSFSKAARRLCISQPTLSESVAKLEEETGMVLYDRRLRSLTPAGRLYLSGAEEYLGLYEEFQKELFLFKRRFSFGLRLGICSLALSKNLSSSLLSFFQLHPRASLSLHQDSDRTLCSMVHEGHLDLALIQATEPDVPGLGCYTLSEEEVLIYLPSQTGVHLDKLMTDSVLREDSLRSLLSTSILLPEEGHAVRVLIDSLYAKMDCTPRIRLECSRPHILAEYLNAGIGMTILSASYQSTFPEACIVHFAPRYSLYWNLIYRHEHPETEELAGLLSKLTFPSGGAPWTHVN